MGRVGLESRGKRGSDSELSSGPQLPGARHRRLASVSVSLKVSGEGWRAQRLRLPGEGKHTGLGGARLQCVFV